MFTTGLGGIFPLGAPVILTAGAPVMFTTGLGGIFPLGAPVILTAGAPVMFTTGVLTGAGVSLTGIAVVTAVVTVVVDGDELVHPVIRTMPIRKTATANAMQRVRFWPEIFLGNREIEFMCTHL
ncbi:MAG: hypothetical protein ABSG49_00945 [Methanoregula sp.]|jgi:hypothetical protein|uniref:hypothetical protein n=1 Tax=Methanoregula sp. TaxID=2052170 RepID=UPI003C164F75